MCSKLRALHGAVVEAARRNVNNFIVFPHFMRFDRLSPGVNVPPWDVEVRLAEPTTGEIIPCIPTAPNRTRDEHVEMGMLGVRGIHCSLHGYWRAHSFLRSHNFVHIYSSRANTRTHVHIIGTAVWPCVFAVRTLTLGVLPFVYAMSLCRFGVPDDVLERKRKEKAARLVGLMSA